MSSSPLRVSLLALALLWSAAAPVSVFAQQEEPDVPSEVTEEVEAATPRDPLEIYADLNLFGEVFDRIRSEYVDAPDEKELIQAALNGMLTSLDPHSYYMTQEEYEETRRDMSGEFGGLGIEVTMENEVVKVVTPMDDTPAQKAGILPNDLIIEIDGQSIQGQSLDEAVGKMRGEVGTSVQVTVAREGVSEPLKFDLKREVIAMRVVRWSMEGDVAVIRLASFTEQTFVGLQKAINDIYKETKDVPPKGIILDLRNNPGGLVDQAVYVSDVFLKQGAVVLTRGRVESESARYDAQPDDLDAKIADIPVVVLINGGSASAAEIVAGALQDHKRATLVGTRSFGKGSVQSVIGLAGNGAMRLTTARYYTPNNRSIQASGIHPDIEITQTVPDEFKGKDELIGEAGLAGEIGGGTEEKATTGSSVYVPSEKADDDQLQYAIKLIDGVETNDAFPPKAS